jgi:hypothetical protein
MIRRSLLLVLLAAPAASAAQETPTESVVDCGAAGGGTLRGELVERGRRVRDVAGAVVRLPETACPPTAPDARGRFAFRNAPAGIHVVTASAPLAGWGDPVLGNEDWTSIAEVRPGETLEMEWGLLMERPLETCRARPRCARLLAVDTAAVASLTDAERLREAVLRTTVALAAADDYPPEWTVCVDEAEAPAVVGALRARFGEVAPWSRCTGRGKVKQTHALRVDRRTGRASRRIHAREAAAYGDLRLVQLASTGMRFRCVFQRRGAKWAARTCQLLSIF